MRETFYEPRLYFDDFVFTSGVLLDAEEQSEGDLFNNTEQYPVRFTHMTAAISVSPLTDSRDLQYLAFRARIYDEYYPSSSFVQLPALHNVGASASDVMSHGLSCWKFEKSLLLGQRDKLVVEAVLTDTPASARPIVATFSGAGLESRRPIFLGTRRDITDTIRHKLDTEDLIVDGAEPAEIDHMSLYVGAPLQDASVPIGDLRRCHFGVRRTGRGTDQWWQKGPGGDANTLAPASLWGASIGRAVVHRLPGEGWLLAPGQGFTFEIRARFPDVAAAVPVTLWVGFLGYAVIS